MSQNKVKTHLIWSCGIIPTVEENTIESGILVNIPSDVNSNDQIRLMFGGFNEALQFFDHITEQINDLKYGFNDYEDEEEI